MPFLFKPNRGNFMPLNDASIFVSVARSMPGASLCFAASTDVLSATGSRHMQILAHRGYHANAPQNTLRAFEQAVALGVDGIETDIRLTADGVPIFFHDRCTKDGVEVSRLTHAELEDAVKYPVPTLESALAEFGDILWNLEIKTAAALQPTATILKRYLSTRRLLVTSFLHPAIQQIVRLVDVEAGLLFANRPLGANSYPPDKIDPHITTLVWDFQACDKELIAEAVGNGYKNLVYGPITLREHEEASTWMLQGIITDYPKFFR
jgi:glycerophosphoryl diester phosphodiesterase